jgi:hypothetical protein
VGVVNFKVVSLYLSRETETNHEKSGGPISSPKMKPRTSLKLGLLSCYRIIELFRAESDSVSEISKHGVKESNSKEIYLKKNLYEKQHYHHTPNAPQQGLQSHL